jgi:hypothetical protein
MPLTQMQMCMSKNKLLWCVLPSSATENAKTDGCNNKFTILLRLVATKTWMYWLTLWSLILPNFYTLRRSLAWWIMTTICQNDMPHPT